MATIRIDHRDIVVELTTAEKIAGVHGSLRFPASAVTASEVVPEGPEAVRGVRAPGLAIPGRRYVGTWRQKGGKEFVAVRRGQPALRLSLQGQPFASVLVGVDQPEVSASQLTATSS